MSHLKIISLNTRGTHKNFSKIKEEIKNYDIILLQEQHIDKHKTAIERYKNELKCELYYTTDNKNNLSIMTLIKRDIGISSSEYKILIKGRVINVTISFGKMKYNIINVYAPAAQKDRLNFFAELKHKIEQMRNIILGGDLNTIINMEETNGKFEIKPYMKFMKYMITDLLLIDPHENIWDGKIKYTFTFPNKTRKRLDRFLISNNLRNRMIHYSIEPNTFSDHDAITLKLDTGTRKKWGKGTWKLNNKYLKDEIFIELIEETIAIEKDKKNLYKNQSEWWDNLKMKIKRIAINYGINKTNHRNKKEKELKMEIKTCQIEIDHNNNTRINQEMLIELKEDLSTIEDKKSEGARIRAKIDEIEQGEKSTKFFFSREHSRGEKKQIRVLLKNLDTVHAEKEIIEEVSEFYKNLYESEEIDETQLKNNLEKIYSKITDEDLAKINEFISIKEVETAINEMKNNKSPGEDGLNKEFYLKFKKALMEEITVTLNNIIYKGELPKSQTNAIVTLIFKKGDHRNLKNWRPVSLLNVDYKILSKIMANRLKDIMNKLVPTSQKCGVKGRFISDILITIDSIIRNYENENKGAIIMTLDQEKAFDRINHRYLFEVLNQIGIMGNFQNWIKAMYSNITSQIQVNGALTEKLDIKRSVRQGCPLSMILFVLTTIPLINMIEEDIEIKGIKTPYNNELKILAYADDTTIFLSNTKSIEKVFKIYAKHSAASESKLNKDKTEILKIGYWKYKMPNEEKYTKLIKEEVKILGCIFTSNSEETGIKNWNIKTEKIKKIIQIYENRNLSLIGKVLLTNSIVLSQIWHLGSILPIRTEYIKKIEKLINSWMFGKRSKNIIKMLKKSKEQGGLGLLDLEKRLNAIKIKSLDFITLNTWPKDFDFIIYWAGTKTLKLANRLAVGPKCENCTNIYGNTVTKMFNLKTEKPDLNINESSIKDIELALYPPDNTKIDYMEVHKGKYTKFRDLNYRIASGILKTATFLNLANRACIYCNEQNETIIHLFLNCRKLEPLREEMGKMIRELRKDRQTLTWEYIINMKNLKHQAEYEIITLYKLNIWNNATNVRWGEKTMNIRKVSFTFRKDIKYYIKLIYGL